jgi:hypothetical protein
MAQKIDLLLQFLDQGLLGVEVRLMRQLTDEVRRIPKTTSANRALGNGRVPLAAELLRRVEDGSLMLFGYNVNP